MLFCCSSQRPVLWCARTLLLKRCFAQSVQKNAVTSQFRNINTASFNTQQLSREQYQRSSKYLSNSVNFVNDHQLTGIYIRHKGSLYRLEERQFHTSGRKDAFPPVIWAAVSMLTKAGAVLSGRYGVYIHKISSLHVFIF